METIVIEGAKLRQVGWMIWGKMNPNNRHFSTESLTEQGKKNGYLSKPVYEIVD